MIVRKAVAALVTTALVAASSPAAAQQYLVGAAGSISSGVEGGGGPTQLFRRPRTTLRLGGDLRIDEMPKDVFAAALVLEIEPHAAVGANLRYIRALAPRDRVHIGVEALVAPQTLFGASAGYSYHLPLSQSVAFTVGPTVQVFFLGGDLPDGTVIWQALAEVGFRADIL